MMTEFYPAPPGVLMAGATVAFGLAWGLLSAASHVMRAPGLRRENVIVAVGMVFIALFVIVDAALSTQVSGIWTDFGATTLIMTGAGLLVATLLACVPSMRRGGVSASGGSGISAGASRSR